MVIAADAVCSEDSIFNKGLLAGGFSFVSRAQSLLESVAAGRASEASLGGTSVEKLSSLPLSQ